VALVQLIVVYQIRQGQYREIERSELVARQLTQKEELQLYLYEQVGYDYKQYDTIRKVIEGVPQRGIHGESNWDVDAVGDGGLAISVSQFHEETFNWFSELSGIEGEYTNPFDQLKLMVWAFNNNLARHWTVYRLLQYKGLV
jgi:hypothetical protein